MNSDNDARACSRVSSASMISTPILGEVRIDDLVAVAAVVAHCDAFERHHLDGVVRSDDHMGVGFEVTDLGRRRRA